MQGKAQRKVGAQAAPPPLTQASVEATVFVRGLPLDTLQYELQDRMSRYGRLKACRCNPRTTFTLNATDLLWR